MRIPLSGAKNTRDLGGTVIGNRKIRSGLLIRSGVLSALTDDDIGILERYPLRRVIDLRTPPESASRKNIILKNVEYISLPLVQNRVIGVTREQTFAEQILGMAADPTFNAEQYMQNIYRNLVFADFSAIQYRKFFNILLAPVDGATLWHCSAGKDRAGVCTALLLSALGADQQTIMEDYLLTNQYVADDINSGICSICDSLGDSADLDKIRSMVTTLYSVHESYLLSVINSLCASCGSIENYLKSRVGLSPCEIDKLKEMYLEP